MQPNNSKIIENNNSQELKTMLLEVMKENKELQKTILNTKEKRQQMVLF